MGTNNAARGDLEDIRSDYMALRARAKAWGSSWNLFNPDEEGEGLRLEWIHLVRQPL